MAREQSSLKATSILEQPLGLGRTKVNKGELNKTLANGNPDLLCAFRLYAATPAIIVRPKETWSLLPSSSHPAPSHTMAAQLHHSHRSLSTIATVSRSTRPTPDHG